MTKSKKKGKSYFSALGAVVGIANGLFGSGGGMLAVPILEKGGLKAKEAHATSIALTLVLSVISGFVYFKSGAINLSDAIKYVPLGFAGAIIGAKLLTKLNEKTLHRIFGCIMIIAGIRIFMKG